MRTQYCLHATFYPKIDMLLSPLPCFDMPGVYSPAVSHKNHEPSVSASFSTSSPKDQHSQTLLPPSRKTPSLLQLPSSALHTTAYLHRSVTDKDRCK